MYRIVFNPKTGKWNIELAGFWGLYWVAVRAGGDLMEFETYQSAKEKTVQLGLSLVYRDFSMPRPWASGGYVPERKMTHDEWVQTVIANAREQKMIIQSGSRCESTTEFSVDS